MRINENTLLEGKNIVLVPYNSDHVPRYHEWMSSEELQKLTASEPLSLEQEFEMQCSWREDDDKCTFIILDKQKWAEPSVPEEQCMVGDVNIFLTDPDDHSLAEVEVMIAEPGYRGRGLGKEVTQMMLCYAVNRLGVRKFEAKIALNNTVSIALFKKLGFGELSVSEVFGEMTLGMNVDEAPHSLLLCNSDFMQEHDYRKARESRH
ncbi:alpha/beta-tubulin-N-acetyltransferase 9 [Alosa pseudoharengus]|uniref:alpha/beta-tubulin-N-acetyltransferase 9 n=1 Tax=Alosa pseudoharengus TaxID=34774 RepID=UPI003F8BFB49